MFAAVMTVFWFAATAEVHAETTPESSHAPLSLRDDDTVVWLGATFMERMQQFGYLESILLSESQATPLRFRNLGWSGDEATGISRAVFGAVEDGYKRLEKDLATAKPTVVVVQYGAVEAEHASLDEFRQQVSRLLDTLSGTKARLVLLSPLHRTQPQPFFPDPANYNQKVDALCEVLEAVASQRELPYIDARDLLNGVDSHDGIVPSAAGYRQLAPRLAERLGYPTTHWSVALSRDGDPVAAGASLDKVKWTETGVSFEATDEHLVATAGESNSRLRVAGLPTGTYAVRAGGLQLGSFSAAQLAAGVSLPNRGGAPQAAQLRKTVMQANELFFHRHRPQNETYLFLFRKHEQGNNAVEIPQFDPLIQQTEARIGELRRTRPQPYTIAREN
ncbi:MAG: hypothetical protein KDB14_32810 [Planctomycetales bacterium]|nr:hypothetical protein [Planctomycetales bacterium]